MVTTILHARWNPYQNRPTNHSFWTSSRYFLCEGVLNSPVIHTDEKIMKEGIGYTLQNLAKLT